MNIGIVRLCTILTFVLVAIAFDLKSYLIPNRVNVAGAIMGLFLSLSLDGLGGFLYSLIVMLLTVVVLFPLFAARVVGAGDIKLLAAIGTYVKLKIVNITILALVVTAVIGMVSVLVRVMAGVKLRYTKIHLSVPIGIATMGIVLVGM